MRVLISYSYVLPPECFYSREGLWYYAGSYQAFQLEDLTAKEWAQLPTEVNLSFLL